MSQTFRVSMFLVLAAGLLSGCGGELGEGQCTIDECGISCFDPELCGSCGNEVCEWYESIDACGVDCCDPTQCDPSLGDEYGAGGSLCEGAPDGTPCDDGDPSNGMETCQSGTCRREPAHCRCQGSVFPSAIPTPQDGAEEPPVAEYPPWQGSTPDEPSFVGAWGHERIDLSRAWQRTDGDPSVLVGLIDSGCDERNVDLAGRIAEQADFVDGVSFDEAELHHGTFMANVITAQRDGAGVVGVAPGVRLLCARVFVATGEDASASHEDIAEGIDWAVERGADVVVIPLGGPESTTVLEEAVQRAIAADVVVVAPSGSTGGNNVDLFPAAYPDVLSVAASDHTDLPDPGTALSPDTDLLAPGRQILSSVAESTISNENGSSVAAAYVAGVAALVRSAEPSLDQTQVRALLRARAAPVPMDQFERFFRARRLDAGESVGRASPTFTDVAVSRAVFIGPSGLPGTPRPARVVIENRGVTELSGVTLEVATEGGTTVIRGSTETRTTLPAIAVGDSAEVMIDVTPAPASTEVALVLSVAVAGDGDASNDTRRIVGTVAPEIHHRLRIERAHIIPRTSVQDEHLLEVVIENDGNVAEPESVVRVLELVEGDGAALRVPSLAPGERAVITAPVSPAPQSTQARHVVSIYLQPARGQTDVIDAWATINYRSSSTDTPLAHPMYAQWLEHQVIADAPWRTIRDVLPVLVFYASTRWIQGTDPGARHRIREALIRAAVDVADLFGDVPIPEEQRAFVAQLLSTDLDHLMNGGVSGSLRMDRVIISNPTLPEGEPLRSNTLFEEGFYRNAETRVVLRPPSATAGGWGRAPNAPRASSNPDGDLFRVTDEFGNDVPGDHLLQAYPVSGEHRLVWIPVTDIVAASSVDDYRPNPSARGAYIRADFTYRTFLVGARFSRIWQPHKVMFVALGEEPFPELHTGGHYFDPHFHSAAEFWPGTYILGPAKAFGGPLEMLFATAWSLGMIDVFDSVTPQTGCTGPCRNRMDNIIITDHNTFLEDRFAPAGPAQVDLWRARPQRTGNRNTEVSPAVRWDPEYPILRGSDDDVIDGEELMGSPELERIRSVVGNTAGEEVSLWGGPAGTRSGDVVGAISGARRGQLAPMGRHALLFDQRYHVNGVWGTPDSVVSPSTHCTPSYDNFLRRVAGGPTGAGDRGGCPSLGQSDDRRSGRNIRVVGGFTYAAHPFDGLFTWDPRVLRHALSLPPINPTDGQVAPDRSFMTADGAAPNESTFAFRGLQFWNWGEGQRVTTTFEDMRRTNFHYYLNPFWGAPAGRSLGPWEQSCGELRAGNREGGRRNQFYSDFLTYLDAAAEGLSTTFDARIEDNGLLGPGGERPRFFRKIFMIGGSDAHGDFNWHEDIMTSRAQLATAAVANGNVQSDGAYARPRTYVFGRLDRATNTREPGGLEDLRRGRAVPTNGPILDFYIDSDSRGANVGAFTSRPFFPVWHDDQDRLEDLHGFMGGDGARDAEGTVFIPVQEATPEGNRVDPDMQRPVMHIQCANIAEFGGEAPTEFELFTYYRSLAPLYPIRTSLGSDTPCDGSTIEHVLDLDDLDEPAVIVAHVAFDRTCPAIHEAWTNPIWIAPVAVRLPMMRLFDTDTGAGNDFVLNAVPNLPTGAPPEEQGLIEIEFPISMAAGEDVVAQLFGITASTDCPDDTCLDYNILPFTGGMFGNAELEPVAIEGEVSTRFGWHPVGDDPATPEVEAEAASSVLRLRIPIGDNAIRWVTDPIGFEQDDPDNPGEVEFRQSPGAVLIIRGRDEDDNFALHDAFGNSHHFLMIRFQPDYIETRFDFVVPPPPGDGSIINCISGAVPAMVQHVRDPITDMPGAALVYPGLLAWGETVNTNGAPIDESYTPFPGVTMTLRARPFPDEGLPICGNSGTPTEHRHHRYGHQMELFNPLPDPPASSARWASISRFEFPLPTARLREQRVLPAD